MRYKIMPAKLKDIKEVAKLAEMFEKEQFKTIKKSKKSVLKIEETTKNIQKILEQDLRKIYKRTNSKIFIAKDKDEIIGYFWISIRNNARFAKVKKFGRLNFAFIKKQYRGKGIFNEFMKEAIKWFKKKKIKIMTLQTKEENKKAQKIYLKKGFVPTSIEMTGEVR